MRQPEHGVVLVTILSVMALCATVIVAMTTRSEQATVSTAQGLDQTQAQMLAASAESLVLAALQQDLLTAPQADGPGEAWAQIGRSEVVRTLGTVEISVWDESARFNLNTLLNGSPSARHYLKAIVSAAGLPPEVAVRISAALRGGRPLQQMSDLVTRSGLSEAEVVALGPLATCTPVLSATVNLNTAPEVLVQVLLQNPGRAAQILARRQTELITPAVLAEMGVILPAGLSLRTDIFGLQIVAAVGNAKVQTYTRIQRWIGPDRAAHTTISARKWIATSFAPDPSG